VKTPPEVMKRRAAVARLTGRTTCPDCGKEVGVYNVMAWHGLRIMRHFIVAPGGPLVECSGSWASIPSGDW
jgi:hypothetical protein